MQRDWSSIRHAYASGQGSLRELADRFAVPLRTLERRCSQEGWRQAVAATGGTMAAVAAEVAVAEGRRIGLTAGALVERTLADIPVWLDRIEALAAHGEVHPQALRSLVQAWREVIGVGRETFGLNAEQPNKHMHVHVMARTRDATYVDPASVEESTVG